LDRPTIAMTDNLTAKEAARELGVTLHYVYWLIWEGTLEADKSSGRWAIPRAAVEARRASVAGHGRSAAARREAEDDADAWKGRAREAAARR
jgi:excisionase family DNA binding protein